MKQQTLFDFNKRKQPEEKFYLPKVGDKVLITDLELEGTVFYVDSQNLYNHHFRPIQVELREKYNDMIYYRTDMRNIRKIGD